MPSMPRFQFTLRDLFLATTLIAVGVGGVVWSVRKEHGLLDPLAGITVIASAAMIGAGIGTPFQRKLICAAIAVALLILVGLLGPWMYAVPKAIQRP